MECIPGIMEAMEAVISQGGFLNALRGGEAKERINPHGLIMRLFFTLLALGWELSPQGALLRPCVEALLRLQQMALPSPDGVRKSMTECVPSILALAERSAMQASPEGE